MKIMLAEDLLGNVDLNSLTYSRFPFQCMFQFFVVDFKAIIELSVVEIMKRSTFDTICKIGKKF